MISAKLQNAARKVIEKYLYEMAPHFEGRANWEIVWRVERRFGLVGYGDHLERTYLTRVARERVQRCRLNYTERPTSDHYAFLRDAECELGRLTHS